MTDKVKLIRKELEHCYNEAQSRVKLVKDEYYEGKVDAYRNVLCIFDSLQEDSIEYNPFDDFRHTDSEEPVSEDLEEEKTRLFGDCKVRRGAFELGTQWQKERMMKEIHDIRESWTEEEWDDYYQALAEANEEEEENLTQD